MWAYERSIMEANGEQKEIKVREILPSVLLLINRYIMN